MKSNSIKYNTLSIKSNFIKYHALCILNDKNYKIHIIKDSYAFQIFVNKTPSNYVVLQIDVEVNITKKMLNKSFDDLIKLYALHESTYSRIANIKKPTMITIVKIETEL